MITIIVVAIIICVLFTVAEIGLAKKNPTAGLHNLPPEIQRRVHSLPEYKGKSTKILSARERIFKKLPAVVLLLAVFTGIVYMSGARAFFQSFISSFAMWTVIKLYVTLVLSCGWYAHTPSAWIPGTEDMEKEYKNYRFYLSSIPRSLFVGAIVSGIVALIIMLITKI